MKALVVEDAPEVVEAIVLCLIMRWPDMILLAMGSGAEAIQFAQGAMPDIVLLDLGLGDVYGLQVLKEIRRFSDTPVVIITANGEEVSRLTSYEMGTDDYLVKPFSHVELLGSITAALSRTRQAKRQEGEDLISSGGLVVDLPGRRVLRSGVEVHLTPTEWALLTTLAVNHGRVVPYTGLAQAGWGTEGATHAVVNDCIRRLQSKVGVDRRRLNPIRSHRDEGYSLVLF